MKLGNSRTHRVIPRLVMAVVITMLVERSATAGVYFRWSSNGSISGMTCIHMLEGASPLEHTWRDNYLCTIPDIGLRWSSNGPSPHMRCTQIIEPAEPPGHTWRDNYLCLPDSSPITLKWSFSGPIHGLSCLQINEPRDPHTWDDNYLCY
jgi:serine protease